MKALDKKQKLLLGGITGALTLTALLLILPRLAPEKGATEETVVGVIPEADLAEEDESKTGSYRKGGTISDYWDELGEDSSAPVPAMSEGPDSSAAPLPQGSRRPPSVGVKDLFGDYKGADAPEPAPKPERKRGGSRQGSPRQEPASRKQDDPALVSEPEPVRIQVKRSGSVSSLDEDVPDDLGNGFSTLDGTDRWVEDEAGKPYRCMFTRDEKVKNGQRITVRLLEDLVIGGVHVPQNTHLQGLVSIAERMGVSITSLDVGGRILTFHFEAFDTDGGQGIYCSDLSQPRKDAAEQGLSTVGGLLNSRLGRVARDAASVGASIVRNKAGEATVSVPAGYTFYIIQQTR